MVSFKSAARATGLGYLSIFILGLFANFYTLENMLVAGNASSTAGNISSQTSLFTMGLVAFVLMVIVDILLAFPLYKLLKSVSTNIAKASSLLRIINGGIFAFALISLFEIALQSNNIIDLESHVLMLLDEFEMAWNIGLLFFGGHLILLGWLVFRSPQFPSIIGLLLQVAGITYLTDSGGQLFLVYYENYQPLLEMMVIVGGVIGEFSLTLSLLRHGFKTKKLGK